MATRSTQVVQEVLVAGAGAHCTQLITEVLVNTGCSTVHVSGTILDITGAVLPFATVTFALFLPQHIPLSWICREQILAWQRIEFTANVQGNISGEMVPNDFIDPPGTFYQMTVADQTGRYLNSHSVTLSSSQNAYTLTALAQQ
jgi:hypothetical protein